MCMLCVSNVILHILQATARVSSVHRLLTVYTMFFYLWGFIAIMFISITLFSKNSFEKLFISLESKYKKLQFGIGIRSIVISTQKLCISISCHDYNKTYRRKSLLE